MSKEKETNEGGKVDNSIQERGADLVKGETAANREESRSEMKPTPIISHDDAKGDGKE